MRQSQEKTILQWIISTGFLTEDQIEEALSAQQTTGENLRAVLLRLKFIPDKKTGQILQNQIGIPLSDLDDLDISEQSSSILSQELARKHRVVPAQSQSQTQALVTDDIYNIISRRFFEIMLGPDIEFHLVDESQLDYLLQKYCGTDKIDTQDPLNQIEQINIDLTEDTDPDALDDADAPIIRLVYLIISEAIQKRASDVHLEPLETHFRVRYRIDGILHVVNSPPKKLQSALTSRIKIMAGMDIAEKRFPQDGRIMLAAQGKSIDLRVSTLPAVYGESIVLRILDKTNFSYGVEELGFVEGDLETFKKLTTSPHGIILDTGPTGSGKSTTLYAMLTYLNTVGRKIISVEDPIEYQITGINQVQVKSSIGMSFAAGLKSMLRQAPDIIMIGEIRDFETAQIAMQAALTGHLVISTLHTNDAIGATTRLIDMGIKPYIVASCLQGVIAQRLIRRLCPNCKRKHTLKEEEKALLAESFSGKYAGEIFYDGKGCQTCHMTGYLGRIGIFELFTANDVIRHHVSEGSSEKIIFDQARESGMNTLREDAIRKAVKGETSLSEVLRVS